MFRHFQGLPGTLSILLSAFWIVSGAILRAFQRPIVVSRESFEASGQPLVGPSQLLASGGSRQRILVPREPIVAWRQQVGFKNIVCNP